MANNTGKKYGGREAGTPNKLTKELRAVLKNIMHQEIELLPEHLSKLEIKERLELLDLFWLTTFFGIFRFSYTFYRRYRRFWGIYLSNSRFYTKIGLLKVDCK